MIRLFQKKKLSLIPILLGTIILSICTVIPLLHKLNYYVNFYDPVLNETTPTIIVQNGRIELEGNIPQCITLANGVQVFFDETVDDSVFQSSPPSSVFISETQIWFKTNKSVKKFYTNEIKIDKEPIVLEPLQVKRKLHQLRSTIFTILSVLLICAIFGLLVLAAFFAAGIGIMIDAFQNGPYSFSELLNWASLLLVLSILIWILFTACALNYLGKILILYFFMMAAFVYLSRLISRHIVNRANRF